MTVFLVLQKPDSKYSDEEGACYEYPLGIPNGRRIEEGDYLLCCLTSKESDEGRRVFGIGLVEWIDYYQKDGRDYARADYSFYRTFDPPLTFDQIGGDPRNNMQNAINRIPDDSAGIILELVLDEGLPHQTHIDKPGGPPEELEEESYGPDYPLVKVFGRFPVGAVKSIADGVAKKEKILTSLRNIKGIDSQDIEKLLIGEGTPLTRLGYYKKKFKFETTRAEVDGFNEELGIAIEIEKGRGVAGHQIMLDLWKFIVTDEIRFGVIIIPTISREGKEKPFQRTVARYTPLESKLGDIGIDGLAVIGY